MDSRKSASPEGSSKRARYGPTPDNTLNVLILGGTGVGKTTWINSIANYLEYESLDAAQLSNDPKWKIPSSFTISDEKTIFVGPADGTENEQTKVGESSTMFPQAHEFQWRDQKVRFIDTPGIGDSRGLPQDKINLKNIFDYIEEYPIDNLSAIIILMKPNQKVFTPAFSYFISELFTHLPKSCAENVLFGFTGTRPFCYQIADTLDPLQQFLATIEERQNVSLKVNQNTAFCFDNEAFRFLFASLAVNGITFTDKERENCAASWDQSVKETQRFLDRVSSLIPHDTKDIIALNEARQYISMLSNPLASVYNMIQLNIDSIDAEVKRVMDLETDSASFEQELTKQHKKVYYVSENLPQARMVCTSRDCTEMDTDEYGTSQVVYKTLYHDPCYLEDVEPKAGGNPELQKCTTTGGSPNCKECGCLWNVHMHMTYKQTMHTEMVDVVDEDIKRLLSENGDNKKALETTVANLVATSEEYKAEKVEIGNIAAMFGAFLEKNAIMPSNDAVEKYIELSIQNAQHLAELTKNTADIGHVKTLGDWLERYKQQKHGEANGCTAAEVKRYCDRLLNLNHSGCYIKEMFECEIMSMQTQGTTGICAMGALFLDNNERRRFAAICFDRKMSVRGNKHLTSETTKLTMFQNRNGAGGIAGDLADQLAAFGTALNFHSGEEAITRACKLFGDTETGPKKDSETGELCINQMMFVTRDETKAPVFTSQICIGNNNKPEVFKDFDSNDEFEELTGDEIQHYRRFRCKWNDSFLTGPFVMTCGASKNAAKEKFCEMLKNAGDTLNLEKLVQALIAGIKAAVAAQTKFPLQKSLTSEDCDILIFFDDADEPFQKRHDLTVPVEDASTSSSSFMTSKVKSFAKSVVPSKLLKRKRADSQTQQDNSLEYGLLKIVVVGNQSSGKSSVLERIVGHDFLSRGINAVTCMPIELRLHYVSNDARGVQTDQDWVLFEHNGDKPFTDFAEVRDEIQAQFEKVKKSRKTISSVPLVLNIYSENVVDITLVDLPGLIAVASDNQSKILKTYKTPFTTINEVFVVLIRKRIVGPCSTTVNDVYQILKRYLDSCDHLKQKKDQFPNMVREIEEVFNQVLHSHLKPTEDRVNDMLKAELDCITRSNVDFVSDTADNKQAGTVAEINKIFANNAQKINSQCYAKSAAQVSSYANAANPGTANHGTADASAVPLFVKLINDYFSIVLKKVQDSMQKYINLFLIDAILEGDDRLHNQLTVKLNCESRLDELFRESEKAEKFRSETTKHIETLEKALDTIEKVKRA